MIADRYKLKTGNICLEITEETELDYVWLTKQGIFEQMKVSDNAESAGDVWADDERNSEETQTAAQQIANNIGRNETTQAVEASVTVAAVEYTVTLDIETRELVVVKEETPEETVEEETAIASRIRSLLSWMSSAKRSSTGH